MDPLEQSLLELGGATSAAPAGDDPLGQSLLELGGVSTRTAPAGGIHPAIAAVASRLQVDPDHLWRVIQFESGGRPDRVNGKSGATGLIQFMPKTAAGLGTTTEALRGMTIEQQAPYVERYLRNSGATGKGFSDLYASVLWPAAVGQSLDYPLFQKGSREYEQNKGLDIDRDGRVTKAEAARRAYGGETPEEKARRQDNEARLGMRRGEILAAQDSRQARVDHLHVTARSLETEIARKEAMGKPAKDGRRQLANIYGELRRLQGVPDPQYSAGASAGGNVGAVAPTPWSDPDSESPDGETFRLQMAQAARKDPKLAPLVPKYVAGEARSMGEAFAQGREAIALPARAATDALGEATLGARHGWWLDRDPNAPIEGFSPKDQGAVVNFAAATIIGAVTAGASTAAGMSSMAANVTGWGSALLEPVISTSERASEIGASKAIQETAQSFRQSVAFMDKTATPTERGIRFATAAMLGLSIGHGAVAARSAAVDGIVAKSLVRDFPELNLSKAAAKKIVQDVRGNLYAEYGGGQGSGAWGKITNAAAALRSRLPGVKAVRSRVAISEPASGAAGADWIGPSGLDEIDELLLRSGQSGSAPAGTAAIERHTLGAPIHPEPSGPLTPVPGMPAAAPPGPPDLPVKSMVPESGLSPQGEPASVSGEVTSYQKTPPRDLARMTAAEIEALADAVRAEDRAIPVEIFGAEGAAAWSKALRMENSMDSARANEGSRIRDELEAHLTPSQRARLFRIGDDHYLDPVELTRNYLQKAIEIDEAKSAKELGWAVSAALKEVRGGHETDPYVLFQVDRATRRAEALGLDPQDVLDAAMVRRLPFDGHHAAELLGITQDELMQAVERFRAKNALQEDVAAPKALPEGKAPETPTQTAKPADSPSRPVRAPLPEQERIPETGTYHAIKTDDGGLYFGDQPHVLLAKRLGIPIDRVSSAGFLDDGVYSESHSDLMRLKAKLANAAPEDRARIEAGATATVQSRPWVAWQEAQAKAEADAPTRVSAEGVPFRETRLNPNEIGVYPGLQYKRAGIVDGTNAVTDALKGVAKYDQATAGPLTAWETTDGRRWVMNGHHRRELAIRTGEKDVPVRIFREADGVTFSKARAYGALQNIKDGKGTAIDAATVLQDLGASVDQLRSYGVNTRSGVGRDAVALLKLSPDAIDLVRDGTVPESVAAGIADAGLSPERQMATMREAARSGLESRRAGEILADRARNVPLVDKSGGTGDLFGDVPMDLALGEQAKISELAFKRLVADKRLLEAMTRGRAVGGTVVDAGAQSEAATIQDLATQVMATDPEVSRILEQEAKSYAERPVKAQLEQAVRRVADAARAGAQRRLEELRPASAGGVGPSAEPGLPDGNAGDVADREIGPQLTLDPENLGDQTGQLGWQMNRPAGSRSRADRAPGQDPLPETETPAPADPEPPRSAPQRAAAKGLLGALRKIFGEKPIEGKEVGMLLSREHGAELARRNEIVQQQLNEAAKIFDRRSPEERLEFIDRMETGASQPTAEDQALALLMRGLMDGRRAEVQALGEGKLETWIENYFPHLWADPDQASGIMARIFGKRPLEGSKGFLKRRSIPTVREGMDAGLVPITDNPAELVVMKIREMDRYILGTKLVQALQGRGALTFTSVFTSAQDLAARGEAKIDDAAFTVYGPHSVEVAENFDSAVRRGLEAFATSIGIDVRRVLSIGRETGSRAHAAALGVSDGAGTVMVKHFTDDGVLVHEIGHELDARYRLGAELARRGGLAYETETNGLAEYRIPEGADVSDDFRAYLMTPEERLANLIHAVVHAPQLAERVAPTSTELFRGFLREHPELRPLLDVRPGVALESEKISVPVPGLQTMGHYVAPIPIAKILNQYLSPGMRAWAGDPSNGLRSTAGYAFRTYMGINNVLNRSNLGLSYFHGFTMVMEASISDVAAGLQELSAMRRGRRTNIVRAISNLAIGSIPGASTVRAVIGGKKVKAAYLSETPSAEFDQIIQGITQGGGRTHMSSFYELGAAARFMRAMRQRKVGEAALTMIPAIFDATAKPVMEWLVPHTKMGAFRQLLQMELDIAGPDITADEFRRLAAGVWDSIDNRFGELVYDNLFWHRTAKDLGMGSVRALGWSLGTIREIGGGGYDALGDVLNGRFRKSGLSRRTAYVIGLFWVSALVGGILHKILTGKDPETLRDYIFPKSGRKNADGTEERLSIPGYMKDVYAYKHDPVGTVGHKLSPLVGLIGEMLRNEDFYSERIRNEDDPLVKQMLQEAQHVAKAALPFTVTSEMRHLEETGKMDVLSFAGVGPAPVWLSRSEAHLKALEYSIRDRPMGSRTHEEADLASKRKQVLKAYVNGEEKKALELLDTLPMTENQRASVYRDLGRVDAGELPIVRVAERLHAEELLRVFDLGTAAERQALAPLLMDRMERDADSGRVGAMNAERVDEAIRNRPELRRLSGN